MTLYYEDDYVQLHHGDARAILGWTTASVLVTDPPYGMNYTGFGGRKGEPRRRNGRLSVSGDVTTEVRDAVLDMWGDRPALVFGRWNLPRPESTRMRLIWDKTPCGFMGDLSMPWGAAEEEIYVLGSGFVGKRSENIIRAQTLMSSDARRPDHPTPKPVALMEALIEEVPSGAYCRSVRWLRFHADRRAEPGTESDRGGDRGKVLRADRGTPVSAGIRLLGPGDVVVTSRGRFGSGSGGRS